MKVRAEINEKEMKESTAKIKKTKKLVLWKVSKIDKLLTRLIKKKRRVKSIKLETKRETLQQSTQK